jgi:tetratricopeptide (TPR) repeat protein/anti-sigma regulatory factor (Ser/Thr protein kinase)
MSGSTSQGTYEIDASREVVTSDDLAKAIELSKKARDLAESGKLEEALALFEAVTSIQKKSFKRVDLYIQTLSNYIEVLIVNNKLEKLDEVLKKCFIGSSSNLKKKFLSLMINVLQSNTSHSNSRSLIVFLTAWLNGDDTYAKLLHLYLNIGFKIKKENYDHEKLINVYELWIRIDPNNISVLNEYATVLVEKKIYLKAFKLFAKALELDPNNIFVLNKYSNALIEDNQIEKALYFLEFSLKINPINIGTIKNYANALIKQKKYTEAAKLFDYFIRNNTKVLFSYIEFLKQNQNVEAITMFFDYALQIDKDNIFVLNNYANFLGENNQYLEAYELFDKSLKIEPDNIISIKSYANLLLSQGMYIKALNLFNVNNVQIIIAHANRLSNDKNFEPAILFFKYALQLDKNDTRILNSYVRILNRYSNALVKQGEYKRVNELFEQCLDVNANDVYTLTSYANTLVKQGTYHRANELFKKCLKLDSNDAFILNSYANALVKQEKYQRANELFEHSLRLDENHLPTLSSYANALVKQEKYQRANELFEKSLKLDRNDVRTLNSYVDSLVQCCSWQRLLELRPYHSYARLQYAKQLEAEGNIEEALTQLLAIDLDTQKTYHANINRLSLGRLYYRLGQIDLGKQFFDEAIANSDEQDKTILYAARSLLATNPNSQEAINLLLKIQEDSPRYAEAMKAISLNADAETSYELFGADEEQIDDIEMLYRAMYHKIGNEIAVLRSISYRLLRRMEGEHPLVKEIVNDFEKLQQGIASQRAIEKAAIAGIAPSNYKQLIEIVSKTAHDISDEVNNQLAVIESKTRRAMRKLTTEDPQYQQFEKLLLQLKITQKAINDLKSINEGKTIRRDRFLVHRLFEKWEPENWTSQPRIDGVRIRLDIRNPDSEFIGDEEKIKSILNELVENSLKHNHGNSNLSIRMYSSDLLNPQDISSPKIPGDRKFLYIDFKDDGQGVPDDKKEWIFQPLKTTSPEDKGSGLGLFIARKTIKKMGGQIREVGEAGKGVRFQIYLPYLSSNAS